jgi:DNA-directed RNA polymerase subunit H (RpoH/RPB5)
LAEEKKEEAVKEDYVLSHKYNPEFKILDEQEAEKLFEELNLKSSLDLPKININDTICKIFKPKVNDILKITRKSYTAGESVFYRVVIDE